MGARGDMVANVTGDTLPLPDIFCHHQAMNWPSTPSPDAILNRYGRFGIHLGLDRSVKLLQALDNPQARVPVVHVAGTNGKGSVCAFLSSILTAAGYRVGRYTSPHLYDWRERICLDGRWIAEADLVAALTRVEGAIDPHDPQWMPTQFEVFTAAMWLYFADRAVDVAVIETGLGGRLDATNVCDRPLASVITSIAMDHWQRLGNTLAAIATEKAGILKPHCPAFVGLVPPEARTAIAEVAQRQETPIAWIEPATTTGEGYATYQGLTYPLPLEGKHQLANSALAIATIRSLEQRGWEIGDRAIVEGMAQARWPGRLQRVPYLVGDREVVLLVDGAHNVAGAEALRQFVDDRYGNRAVTWLVGILDTKDRQGILRALLRRQDGMVAVPVTAHQGTSPRDLADLARPLLDTPPTACDDLHQGLTAALALSGNANPDEPAIVVCGSLYLVGELLQAIAPPGQT